jgi:hypothetical protein
MVAAFVFNLIVGNFTTRTKVTITVRTVRI